MGKKRKRMFESPEERAAWDKRYSENLRALEAHVVKIRAELADKGKTA